MNFPFQVQLIDVGPRDGFQNIAEFIPTQTKLAVIDGLVRAGINTIEITSFVHPKAVPQMADASEIAKAVKQKHPHIRAFALVPNLRGAQNAVAAGLDEVTCVISASEAHNEANVNKTVDESLHDLAVMRETLPDIKIRLDVGTAFGCPFQGQVQQREVMNLIERAMNIGVNEIVLCDTIGVANPHQVAALVKLAKDTYPDRALALHLHNTRGMGLANTLVAMMEGITMFETSVGGLGGCPFAPGAAGNTPTEDTVNMIESMGIQTHIDLKVLLEVVQFMKENIPAPLSSNMHKARLYKDL